MSQAKVNVVGTKKNRLIETVPFIETVILSTLAYVLTDG